MTNIFQDAVHPDIRIGGNKWLPVEMETNMNAFNEADSVLMIVVNEGHKSPPDYDDEVTINIQSDLNGSGLVFTGRVVNYHYMGDLTWRVHVSNACNEVMFEEITLDFEEEPAMASVIVEEAINQMSRVPEYSVGLQDNMSQAEQRGGSGGPDSGSANDPVSGGGKMAVVADGEDFLTTYSCTNEKVYKVLDQFGRWTDSKWWVTPDNTLIFGPVSPTERPLQFVVDADAGKETPPYQSVKVVADDAVARQGWGAKHQVSKHSQHVSVSVTNLGESAGETQFEWGTLTPPTFTYKSKDIKTPQQARATAKEIAHELVEQTKGGWVEVVGRPDITVLDVITMPKNLGGEQYLVGGVKHKMDSSNGYVTRIECAGAIGLASSSTPDADSMLFVDNAKSISSNVDSGTAAAPQ